MEFRSPQVVKPNRARQRELDWEDTRRPAWVAWLGGICAIALLVGITVMAQSDRTSKPMHINGDQLGPFYMSDQAYEQHSRELLDEAEGDEPRWALVSPDKAMGPKDFAKVFDIPHADRVRVSTLLIGRWFSAQSRNRPPGCAARMSSPSPPKGWRGRKSRSTAPSSTPRPRSSKRSRRTRKSWPLNPPQWTQPMVGWVSAP